MIYFKIVIKRKILKKSDKIIKKQFKNFIES